MRRLSALKRPRESAVLFLLSLWRFMLANYLTGMVSWDLLGSGLLLSVPLILLYGSIGILVAGWWQRRDQGQVSARMARWFYFAPRIAGVLMTVIVALFALDEFNAGNSVWESIGAFIIHSLPAIIMAVVLVLTWRRPWIGFFLFLIAGIYFLRLMIFLPMEEMGTLLLFSGPMLAISLLFFANWKWEKRV